MRLAEFIRYLSKSGYTVHECLASKDFIIFSKRLYLGTFQRDRNNIVFWTNDNCILPARDFMLDGLDITEMHISKPYKHIIIIKGFKHV